MYTWIFNPEKDIHCRTIGWLCWGVAQRLNQSENDLCDLYEDVSVHLFSVKALVTAVFEPASQCGKDFKKRTHHHRSQVNFPHLASVRGWAFCFYHFLTRSCTYMYVMIWGLGPWQTGGFCSESQYAGCECGVECGVKCRGVGRCGGALIIIMLSAERWRSAFFCSVPELVGTFRWHCYPACFLRPAAFVRLSPIVLASFVPWLQQWLFFCLLIYICTFCPCVFCLFCSAVCRVFLSSCCRAGKQHRHTRTSRSWYVQVHSGSDLSHSTCPLSFSLLLFTVTHARTRTHTKTITLAGT